MMAILHRVGLPPALISFLKMDGLHDAVLADVIGHRLEFLGAEEV